MIITMATVSYHLKQLWKGKLRNSILGWLRWYLLQDIHW
jgi:hypothetical protein